MSLALSAAEMGTWNLDVSAGVIWWDDRMHSLFGVAPGAFSRNYEDFLALLHDEDRERIRDEFEPRGGGTHRHGHTVPSDLAVGRGASM